MSSEDRLYIDAQFGISGDMLLSALLQLGLEPEAVLAPLRGSVPPFELGLDSVQVHGISALRVTVRGKEKSPPERHLADIQRIIDKAPLPRWVAERGTATFRLLAEAEGKVHGMPMERVHFHEVGAIDSIVDVLGCLLAVHALGPPESVACSSIPLGSGTVETAHGVLPVPAPAALHLLSGIPTHPFDVGREVSTPTGVALARVLAGSFSPPPPGTIGRIGYGAGSRSAARGEPPNLLRAWTITPSPISGAASGATRETIVVLETNLDHISGEDAGHLLELLLEEGALEAFFVATQQKKSRPGLLLTLLCEPERADQLEELIFRESGTLGMRRRLSERAALARDWVDMEISGEKIGIKRAYQGGKLLGARPEFEDLRRVARMSGRSLRDLREEVERRLRAEPRE